MKKIFRVCIALLLCFSLVTPAFALDGIWHNPYGIDDLYDHEPTEIYPLTPIAGEMIYIKSTTWPVEAGQSVGSIRIFVNGDLTAENDYVTADRIGIRRTWKERLLRK